MELCVSFFNVRIVQTFPYFCPVIILYCTGLHEGFKISYKFLPHVNFLSVCLLGLLSIRNAFNFSLFLLFVAYFIIL